MGATGEAPQMVEQCNDSSVSLSYPLKKVTQRSKHVVHSVKFIELTAFSALSWAVTQENLQNKVPIREKIDSVLY